MVHFEVLVLHNKCSGGFKLVISVNLPFKNRIYFEVHVNICSQLRRVLIIYGVKLQDHWHNGFNWTEAFSLNCIICNPSYLDFDFGKTQTTSSHFSNQKSNQNCQYGHILTTGKIKKSATKNMYFCALGVQDEVFWSTCRYSFSVETLYNLHCKISGPLTVWLRLDRSLQTEWYNLQFLSDWLWCWTTSDNSLPAAYELNKTKTESDRISYIHFTFPNIQTYAQTKIWYFFYGTHAYGRSSSTWWSREEWQTPGWR